MNTPDATRDAVPTDEPLDEILAETRRRKEGYAAEHGYNIAAIAQDATARATEAGVELTRRIVRPDAQDA
ncbi:MAG: hypothetical protein AAF845_02345 [Bacteroidota bacterium]